VISDDGKGLVMPAANHGGMGLQIMKYRADMIGGTLEIHCIRKKGTTISCRFPMNDVK
jgi:signal transduction histidine kinase